MPTLEWNRGGWTAYDWTAGGDEWSWPWGGTRAAWYGMILPRIHTWLPSQAVLELAPGFGRWTTFLKDLSSRLFLVDLVERCIMACRRRFAASEHISYFVNDGRSLSMIADGTVDFVFTFDSLVHVDADVMQAYVREFGRILAGDGVAFVHHSNVGSFSRPALDLGRFLAQRHRLLKRCSPVAHNRADDVSAALVERLAYSAGLQCRSQELVNWCSPYLTDCFSVITRRGSRWSRRNVVVKNRKFMRAAGDIAARGRLYN